MRQGRISFFIGSYHNDLEVAPSNKPYCGFIFGFLPVENISYKIKPGFHVFVTYNHRTRIAKHNNKV